MSNIEMLINEHRADMDALRGQVRESRKARLMDYTEMDHAYKELRAKLSAELPVQHNSPKLKGAVAFMVTLLGILIY